jgi:hypothetical protein
MWRGVEAYIYRKLRVFEIIFPIVFGINVSYLYEKLRVLELEMHGHVCLLLGLKYYAQKPKDEILGI